MEPTQNDQAHIQSGQEVIVPDPQAIADRLEELYVNHYDRFVMMRPDGAVYVPKIGKRTMVLAKSNLRRHVQCEYAVSVYAGKEGGKFVCFDVDQGGVERAKQVGGALEELDLDCMYYDPWENKYYSSLGDDE